MTEIIDSEKFQKEIIEKGGDALVDFFATWCAPCKMIAPVIDTVSDRLKDKVSVFKVDIDKNEELAQKFNVRSVPTVIMFKKGAETARSVGVAGEEELIGMTEK